MSVSELHELLGQRAIENEMATMRREDFASYDNYFSVAVHRAIRNAAVYVTDANNGREPGDGKVSVSGLRRYLRGRKL